MLLRHLAAYAELAAQDMGQAQREWSARLSATVLSVAAALFAVMMGCLAVIASTWDTPHRLAAIVWMGVAFAASALLALLYRSQLLRNQSPFLSTVRREWREDRVILDRILSPDAE